jgi:aspartate racemase
MRIHMEQPRKVWGVLGGMGPLSSAEFLKTIYTSCRATRDQDFPVVVVMSDPTFPDRTEALRSGNEDLLLEHLTVRLETLISVGCSQIVICCMTIHALLPKLRHDLRRTVVSLADILLEEAFKERGRYLLLCSEGTREARLFETHPLWSRALGKIILPNEIDQKRIHKTIYKAKTDPCSDSVSNVLKELLEKYGADSFAVGCSEVHIMIKYMEQRNALPRVACIDPFAYVAETISSSTSSEILADRIALA